MCLLTTQIPGSYPQWPKGRQCFCLFFFVQTSQMILMQMVLLLHLGKTWPKVSLCSIAKLPSGSDEAITLSLWYKPSSFLTLEDLAFQIIPFYYY